MHANEHPLPMPATSWRLEAACRDTDPNLFFPTKGDPDYHAQVATALAYCAICPAAGLDGPCLAYAISVGEKDGIWGGFKGVEIRRAAAGQPPKKPARQPARCGTPAGYNRHRRNGEAACDACLEGMAAASRIKYQRSQGAA